MTREKHRNAFDTLVMQLRQSIFLGACVVNQYCDSDKAAGFADIFEQSLERYARLFCRASYQQIPLSHLFSSAIQGEAWLSYEYEHEAGLLDAKNPMRAHYLQQAVRHSKRIDRFINAARRAINLNISPQRPFVMPYRGIFISPYSEAARMRLVRERDYFVQWDNSIVAIVREDGIDKFREIADKVIVLYYDADELLDQGAQLSRTDLERVFAAHLEAARTSSDHIVGEPFAHHLNRCLLRQNVVLRNLHPRLEDEHPAAYNYCEPLVAENTQQLQTQLLVYPSWAPENFREDSDCVQLLTDLEQQIRTHATEWVQQGRMEDTAGLLFQFENVLQADDLLQLLGEL